MEEEDYQRLKKESQRMFDERRELDPDECADLNLDFDAVTSLVNQISVKYLKAEARRLLDPLLQAAIKERVKTSQEHPNDPSAVAMDCYTIGIEYKVSGYKLVKCIIESKYGQGRSITTSQILTNSSTAVSLLDDDKLFMAELMHCLQKDIYSGHPKEQQKECIGTEYEEYLIDRLNEKKLCFETESELRSRGKPKTPDILFLIPMAIPRDTKINRYNHVADKNSEKVDGKDQTDDSSTITSSISKLALVPPTVIPHPAQSPAASVISQCSPQSRGASPMSPGGDFYIRDTYTGEREDRDRDGDFAVVNWIDSKAMFADEETFEQHFEQLRGYTNRYGRGLVIYWHGYAKSLEDSPIFKSTDEMIVLADDFPKEWLAPNSTKPI